MENGFLLKPFLSSRMGLTLLSQYRSQALCHTSFISSPLMVTDMRILSLVVAGLILLVQLHPGSASFYRQHLCSKLDGHCAIDCLTFEEKIGAVGLT